MACLLFSLLGLSLWSAASGADSGQLQQAELLLKITSTGEHFNRQAAFQADAIVRTYASIVNTSTGIHLPILLQRRIADCFRTVYDWENFAPGIAEIVAQQLSGEELDLLVDFYRDRSVPPPQISAFRAGMEKAPAITELATDYIFRTASDCQQSSVRLIRRYVDGQKSAMGSSD